MRKLLLMFLVFCGFVFSASAQQKAISGTVISSVEGEGAMPGVSVSVKGTTIGIVTDINGKYTLAVPENATTLVFSYIGMKKQEAEIGNRSSIDIKPSSGMPGASSQVVIRGARSFTGNNAPLYVVDGMPIASNSDIQSGAGGNFSVAGAGVTGSDVSNRAVDLNPADIESVNILKGQAAAALYGIRASNGVIVITTKSGRNNIIGKPVVSLSHTTAFSEVSRTQDYQ